METELKLNKSKSYGDYRQELLSIEKEIERIDNSIDKLENNEHPNYNKLSQLTNKRLKLKKERKVIKKNAENAFALAYKNFTKTLTLEESENLAFQYYNCLSNRGQSLVRKYQTYYDNDNWYSENQNPTIPFYISIAFMISLFISKKKRLNRYLVFSDSFVFDSGTYCQLYETYLKENNMQRYLLYIKRLVNK